MEVLSWIQNTSFSTWSRESSWALFAYLIVHTIAMGFLVGSGLVIALRVLGLAKSAPLSAFRRLLPFMVVILCVVIVSGLLLLISYPAKHLTNWVFYLKLSLLTAALLLTRRIGKRVLADTRLDHEAAPGWARGAAIACLFLWPLGLTAGKFLEYTNHILLAP